MPAKKKHTPRSADSRREGEQRGTPRAPAAIVGIGASAGGLEAVTELLTALPSKTGLAFVLVQHLAPHHPSMLVELLARHTAMPVEEALDGTAIEPDHLYVIPPNTNLGMLHGVLQVLPGAATHGALTTVDHFLRSLALDQGPQAIGVILSGSASDGTLGMQAIKAQGGITLAQEETSAEHSGMPHSVIAAGAADIVLPPAGIARELVRIASTPPHAAAARSGALGENLDAILFLLRNQTGHDLTGYKPNTIERRIRRRMWLHELKDPADYVRYLQSSPKEVQALFEDVLISVSAFFRDPEAFEALKQEVFPQLLEGRARGDSIRIWVPGCAGGEEAYSIAIALTEYLHTTSAAAPTVQVFASDIDERMILKARAGLYPQSVAADVSEERLQRFFLKTAEGYQVHKSIRDLCVFAVQDLSRDPPFSHMDLISCRNLLIYFGPALQEKVLRTLHYALEAGGYLLLGTSESIGKTADLFALKDKRLKIYKKKSTQGALVRARTAWPGGRWLGGHAEPTTLMKAPAGDVVREAERYILAELSPPALVVNDQMEVVGYSGRTGPYIEPAQGAPSARLLKVVRQELTAALHVAIHKALESGEPTRQEGIRYRQRDDQCYVNLVVTPLPSAPGHVLVVFEEVAPPPAATTPATQEESERTQALEQELSATRLQLQSVINGQVDASEALQAAYEELLSSNEELQGTNEELESAKEELQSTNEELGLVNEEVVVRNRELERANDDLLNLMASAELPMLMLDGELRVRHFTPIARTLLNLIDADVGRPLSHLRTNLDLDVNALDRDLRGVINSAANRSVEVYDRSGRWYTLRMRPYKTKDGDIEGVVLVFMDLSEVTTELAQVQRLAAMVRESADAILLLDPNGRILEWNHGAEALYGYPQAEALGMNLTDLAPPSTRERLQASLRRLGTGETLRHLEERRTTRDGRELVVLLTASPLPGPGGSPTAIAVIEHDITELKHNLERARRLAAVVHDSSDAITVRDFDGRIRAWNRAAERMYGYSEEEALGLNVDRLVPKSARERETKQIERLRRGEAVDRFDTQRITRDERILDVTVNMSLLVDERGDPRAVAVTERKA